MTPEPETNPRKPRRHAGLLIEDSPTYAEYFSLSLERSSGGTFDFAIAETLEQAEGLLKSCDFDIVVVDLGLPDAEGLDTAERTLHAAGDTPVVVLTGMRDQELAVEAVAKGAQDYLIKGSETAIIFRSLTYAIARKQNELQLMRMKEEAAVAAAAHREAEAKAALYEELKAAQAVAESAKTAKDAFMASVTHELRTPLHGVISFARLGATQYGVADRQRLGDFFRRIEASGELLLALVSDLLDLSKLESGHAGLQKRASSLEMKLRETGDEFYPMLAEKNVHLHVPGPAANLCSFDVRLMKQVMRNFLSNALKFSPVGGEIRTGVEYSEDTARLWVADAGPGIPEEEIETVFERFIQSSTTPGDSAGTGLGLTICREIIRAHQGRIWAENRPEGGAIFFAEIPASPVPAAV